MGKLTREEAFNLHVQLWNDIAENGYANKEESCLITKYPAMHDCYFCEYFRMEDGYCEKCPFTQAFAYNDDGDCDDIDTPCTDYETPYLEFYNLINWRATDVIKELRRDLAIEIAQLGLDYA